MILLVWEQQLELQQATKSPSKHLCPELALAVLGRKLVDFEMDWKFHSARIKCMDTIDVISLPTSWSGTSDGILQ